MALPRGVVCPLFSDGKKKINKSQSLLCCVAIGKEVARDRSVLKSVTSRRNFFHRLKRKLSIYFSYQNNSPPICLENLPRIERVFAVRLFLWRKTEQYEIVQIYESESSSVMHHRINILSMSDSNSDLSELYYVWDLSKILTVFTTKCGATEIIKMDLFRALAVHLYPAANSEELDEIQIRSGGN